MEQDQMAERIHALETAQAADAAALAGAQATQAAMQAGTMATMAAGAVSLIVGLFLGMTIANSRR